MSISNWVAFKLNIIWRQYKRSYVLKNYLLRTKVFFVDNLLFKLFQNKNLFSHKLELFFQFSIFSQHFCYLIILL